MGKNKREITYHNKDVLSKILAEKKDEEKAGYRVFMHWLTALSPYGFLMKPLQNS